MAETSEERWRSALTELPPEAVAVRQLFSHLPGSPRCKNCAAPFGGPGAVVARAMGFRRWSRNPKFCNQCLGRIKARGTGGAEVEISMLFADIRGSTSLGETMSASEFAALLDSFYVAAVDVLVREDAIVDKFVGDEVVALFVPAFAKINHAEHAIRAAHELLQATGHARPEGPWVPVGAGVHTGVAYVGSVGAGEVTDITALGDAVNTAARLASAAKTGQVLITGPAAAAAHFDVEGLEQKSLELKGKTEPVQVFVMNAGDAVDQRLSPPALA
jgi:adenylate cyclase